MEAIDTFAAPAPAPTMGVESDESPSIAHLAAALAKAQGSIRSASKDKVNPHFKSNYADLASVWNACREALSANGLAVMQRVSNVDEGVLLTTMLVHSSGEWVRDRLILPVAQRTAQGYGSAITYARRYALAALVGVAADEDDGGNAASESEAPPTQPRCQNGTRTDAVKQQLAQQQPASAPSTVWDRMKATCLTAGKTESEVGGFVKGVTNKSKPSELTEADLQQVTVALQALKPKGGPIVDVPEGVTEEQAKAAQE